MRTFKMILYIAALLALAVLAFPIKTAAASKEEALVFVIDLNLSQPQIIAGPVQIEKVVTQPSAKSAKKTTLPFNPCNCMSYVQYRTGGRAATGIGYARNHPINSKSCQIGAIIVTYESRLGHVGMVKHCDEDNVTIDDYNYNHCKPSIRDLPLNSSLIKGYYIYE